MRNEDEGEGEDTGEGGREDEGRGEGEGEGEGSSPARGRLPPRPPNVKAGNMEEVAAVVKRWSMRQSNSNWRQK